MIFLKGASEHTLKNVSVAFPLQKITCVSGPSGSGKTTLVFKTLFAESQRRFLNSLSTKGRFFAKKPLAPKIDSLEPVLPSFALYQHNSIHSSKETVATFLTLEEDLARFYYEEGYLICPQHEQPLLNQSFDHLFSSEDSYAFLLPKDIYQDFFPFRYPTKSYHEGELRDFSKEDSLWLMTYFSKDDEVLKDFPLSVIENLIVFNLVNKELSPIKKNYSCPICQKSPKLKHRHFALFLKKSALGACRECQGFGGVLFWDEDKIYHQDETLEQGALDFFSLALMHPYKKKLENYALKNHLSLDKKLKDFSQKEKNLLQVFVQDCLNFLESKRYKPAVAFYRRAKKKEITCSTCEGNGHHEESFFYAYKNIAFKSLWDQSLQDLSLDHPLKKITIDLGLGSLKLSQRVKALTPSEYQKLLLAKFFYYQGTDGLFLLDEPSLGLSSKEKENLLKYLKGLCKQGNTVILVEHDEYFQKNSDHLIVMGPKSGQEGGFVTYEGDVSSYKFPKIEYPKLLKTDVFFQSTSWRKNSLEVFSHEDSYEKAIKDLKKESLVFLDGPGSRQITSRSNIGTFLELMQPLKEKIFPKKKKRELFSCETCKGSKEIVTKLLYLEDYVYPCSDCEALGFEEKTLKTFYEGKSFQEYLLSPLKELRNIFTGKKYEDLFKGAELLNLDHLIFFRETNSLSRGELQRIFLLKETIFIKESTVFFMEDLSFGLSHQDLVSVVHYIEFLNKKNHSFFIYDQNDFWAHLYKNSKQSHTEEVC